MAEVCREAQGEAFAEKCVETARDRGYISMSQKYFGLHYMANIMPARNGEFIQQIRDAGFTWFSPVSLPVPEPSP